MAEYTMCKEYKKIIRYGPDFTKTDIDLIVSGQGVFVFKQVDDKPCILEFYSKDKLNKLKVEFTSTTVNVFSPDQLLDKHNTKGLSTDPCAYYWFSLDSQNQALYAGVGETRLDTAIYRYSFPKKSDDIKKFLESFEQVHISSGIKPMSLLRDPITLQIPMIIKDTNELTMNDIATGKILPSANLSTVNRILYESVAGRKFVLDDRDFPDFSKAIERSIATPGLWCNKRLKEKSTEFSKDKPNVLETYLRITLGQNNGESPGVPYVMEIWPIGHYSPVHSHSGANAVIRVLHGNIHVRLFPYLSPTVTPFAETDFKKQDITWIGPTLNQTHQLINLDTNTNTCITIQCYMYDEADDGHYDYFDYIDANGVQQQYEPDSDMDFTAFKELMKEEWIEWLTTSTRTCCCL